MAEHRKLPLLYVDDEEDNLTLFRLDFGTDFNVRTAAGAEAGLAILEEEPIGLVLTDERMPGMSGIAFLEKVVERWPDSVRYIVSAYGDAARLLSAINRGHAHEYILKPWDREELAACIDRGLRMVERRRNLIARAELAEVLEDELRASRDVSRIVGAEGGLRKALAAAERAARSEATVLIRGQTGTGKELIARFIHEHSPRAKGPFIRVNCAALAEGVFESELFGHERGAFTGAHKARPGRFELAQGGTIFLDEIGDVPAQLQVRLLRVLQEREFERVGSGHPVPLDVRVVAATHQDLEAHVREGRFREDLFYRLNVIPIHLPPLRERPQDIEPLLAYLIRKHHPHPGGPLPKLDPELIPTLQRYPWPGNVRELENLVQRALALSDGVCLTVNDFSVQLTSATVPELREHARAAEADQLREALAIHGGNFTRAAQALRVPRTTLVSRAKRHGLL